MNIGDKVSIKTGKRGMPPRGEVIAFVSGATPSDDRVRVKRGALVELYRSDELTVVRKAVPHAAS